MLPVPGRLKGAAQVMLYIGLVGKSGHQSIDIGGNAAKQLFKNRRTKSTRLGWIKHSYSSIGVRKHLKQALLNACPIAPLPDRCILG
jgi:hypothetical protein